MDIQRIVPQTHFCGIELDGWDEVENALRHYGSNASSSFFDEMFSEVKQALSGWPTWVRNFMDEGPATFFRTTVSIGILDRAQDKFFLSISGLKTGERPEVELAVELNKPRVVDSNIVKIEVGPVVDNMIEIDFEPIMAGLSRVMPITLTGETFIHSLAEKSADPHDGVDTIVVFQDERHTVTVTPINIQSRFIFTLNKSTDTWTFNGSRLTAPVSNAYVLGKSEYPPMVSIRILPTQTDRAARSGPLIWYRLEDKAAAMALAEAISDALSS